MELSIKLPGLPEQNLIVPWPEDGPFTRTFFTHRVNPFCIYFEIEKQKESDVGDQRFKLEHGFECPTLQYRVRLRTQVPTAPVLVCIPGCHDTTHQPQPTDEYQLHSS